MTQFLEDKPEVAVKGWYRIVNSNGTLYQSQRTLVISRLEIHQAQKMQSLCIVRLCIQDLAVYELCMLQAAGLMVLHPQSQGIRHCKELRI